MKLDIKAGVLLAFGFALGVVVACLLVSPASQPKRSSDKPIFEMAASDLKPAAAIAPEPKVTVFRAATRRHKGDSFTLQSIAPDIIFSAQDMGPVTEPYDSKSLDRTELIDSFLRKPKVDLMDSREPVEVNVGNLK